MNFVRPPEFPIFSLQKKKESNTNKNMPKLNPLFNFTMNYSIIFARFLMGQKNDFTVFFTISEL